MNRTLGSSIAVSIEQPSKTVGGECHGWAFALIDRKSKRSANADGGPEKICSDRSRALARRELRTESVAVFWPMQGVPYWSATHHFWRMTVGLNRSEKAVVIEEVAARVATAKSIVLAQYRGLGVGHITGLRSQAR